MNLLTLPPERAWQMVLDQLRQDAENAAQVANQGITDVGRNQILILLLVVMLVVVMLLGLAAYLTIRRLIGIRRTFRQPTTGQRACATKAHGRKSEEPDLCQQMLHRTGVVIDPAVRTRT